MQFFSVQGIWYWCGKMLGKNFSQPPSVVMSVKVDNVAIEVGVFDSQRFYRCLLTILDNIDFNQLTSPTFAVVLCIEYEVDVLICWDEFRRA